MKRMKLSKISWLILLAGVFIVVLAGLGLTRSQQLQEQTRLDEELGITETRLNNLQVTDLRQQQEQLQERLDERITELAEAKDRLRWPIESIDVTDEFFSIAHYCDVKVMHLATSTIATEELEGLQCSVISLSASVVGEVSDLINFVISLNSDFTTGIVESVSISNPEASAETEPSSNIQMIVHSYEGA